MKATTIDPTCIECVPFSERGPGVSWGLCARHALDAITRAGEAIGHACMTSPGESSAHLDVPRPRRHRACRCGEFARAA